MFRRRSGTAGGWLAGWLKEWRHDDDLVPVIVGAVFG